MFVLETVLPFNLPFSRAKKVVAGIALEQVVSKHGKLGWVIQASRQTRCNKRRHVSSGALWPAPRLQPAQIRPRVIVD